LLIETREKYFTFKDDNEAWNEDSGKLAAYVMPIPFFMC
jgi:hypothetical protein